MESEVVFEDGPEGGFVEVWRDEFEECVDVCDALDDMSVFSLESSEEQFCCFFGSSSWVFVGTFFA